MSVIFGVGSILHVYALCPKNVTTLSHYNSEIHNWFW